MSTTRREILRLATLASFAGAAIAYQSASLQPPPVSRPESLDPYAPRLLTEDVILEFPRLLILNQTPLNLLFSPHNFAYICGEFLSSLNLAEKNPLKPQMVLSTARDNYETPEFDQFTLGQTPDGHPLITVGLGHAVDFYADNLHSGQALYNLSKDISYNLVFALTLWGVDNGIYTPQEAYDINHLYLTTASSVLPQSLIITAHTPNSSA